MSINGHPMDKQLEQAIKRLITNELLIWAFRTA